MALVASVVGTASVSSEEQLEEAARPAAFHLHDVAFGSAFTRVTRQPLADFE